MSTARDKSKPLRDVIPDSLDAITVEDLAPLPGWGELGESEHFVQFYEADEFLLDSVSGFIGGGLREGEACIIVATKTHRRWIEERLLACGLDLDAASGSGLYVSLDAAESLTKFMVDEQPDPRRFAEVFGDIITMAAEGGRRVRVFGEMVALLWAEGNREAAIRLEELWNCLRETHSFSLFCAYSMNGFSGEALSGPFDVVCQGHSRVIPAESYISLTRPEDRLRAIALLQQRASSLEAEVAERKHAEQVVRESEDRMRQLLSILPVAVYTCDMDGCITYYNQRAAQLWGREPVLGDLDERFCGSYRLRRPDGSPLPHAETPMAQAVKAGMTTRDAEVVIEHPDGSEVIVSVNIVPLFDQAGRQCGAINAFQDISDRKQAEDALKQANSRKDEFLAMLAHELRNPLAPIRNAVQVLRRLGPPDPPLQHARDIIDRQVQHMVRLVDDLLDTSRITQGKITLRKERLELMNVIGRAVEASRPLIDARRHHLSLSLPQDPVRIEGDIVRLAQVISNLLDNAAKYTEEGGHIWLTVEQQEGEVVFRVRDDGVGIPPTLLPHVFNLFTQAERSLDRSQGGLGIGLSLVRSLVEMHGGRVEAHSAGPGKGSEFVVHLPILIETRQTAVGASSSAAQVETPAGSYRVLVVDDNIDSAESLAVLLKLSGHEVQMAHDGMTAIDTAQMFNPQVVFLDIGLPRMDGYEVARRLRQDPETCKSVLVAFTGYGQAEDRRRSKEAGFDHHLVKPVDPEAVEALVNSLVLY